MCGRLSWWETDDDENKVSTEDSENNAKVIESDQTK